MMIIKFSIPTVLLAVFLGLAACAPAGADATQSQRGPITADEIFSAGVTTNALHVVQRLRPQWLVTRGGRTDISENGTEGHGRHDQIRVYMDGARIGDDPSALTGVSVSSIGRIEFLGQSAATTRFGAGHMAGAIVIDSR